MSNQKDGKEMFKILTSMITMIGEREDNPKKKQLYQQLSLLMEQKTKIEEEMDRLLEEIIVVEGVVPSGFGGML
jgi:hypothetical protein